MSLQQDISSIKQAYRETFGIAHERLLQLFLQLQSQYHCQQCIEPPERVDQRLHQGCGYQDWQRHVMVALEKEVAKDIHEAIAQVKDQRECIGQCHMCGVCCELASSEFSYDQLLEKAKHGDWFASQFTSVFLPYDSHEQVAARFPDLYPEMIEQTGGDIYFYHCPYLGEDRRCTIYNDPKRPEICDRYPETPLTLMYSKCGYQPWKKRMLPTTLLAHATLELCHYYVNRIYEALGLGPLPLTPTPSEA